LFKKICDTGSANKRVPDFAYTAPKEFIRGLIDGYYSGDGTINKEDGAVVATSVSEDLILGVSFLLSYFNIFGRLLSWQQKKNNVGSKNIKRTYILRISNGYAQNFANSFTLTEDKKQDRLQNITLNKDYKYINGKTQEKFPFDRDVYFDEVKSVEYVEGSTEFVYDLTVATTRNFQVWNGLNLVDTFHNAGASNKTMTTGVPRFRELIDATKNPKIVNNTIYFRKNCETIQEVKEEVGNRIAGLTFKDITIKTTINKNKEKESWYDSFKILYSDNFARYESCVTLFLDRKKLYDNKLSLESLAQFIESEYDDLFCVFSPPEQSQLDIFVDTEQVVLPEEKINSIDENNAVSIYLEECVLTTIENMYICGIPAIQEVFYNKKNGYWFAETVGTNSKKISKQYSSFKKLLSLPNIDYTKTISNNVWDIYELLDVEAARQFLIEEFTDVMGSGINSCHTELLVDRMTHTGTIASITRYTLKNDDAGPCTKSSFEETLDNFLDAGAQGLVENTKGVSVAVMVGKRSEIGTGFSKTTIDFDALPDSDNEHISSSDSDDE
jgi:DNA-directed RNA polymerase beta' subunit